jgi:hypothetical protein
MMLFQDGSTHEWLVGQPPLDLIVTLDDATSEVYSMFLVDQEGTDSTFRGLAETIGAKGLVSSFYTDRGSHYFFTPKAGEKVSILSVAIYAIRSDCSKKRLLSISQVARLLDRRFPCPYCPRRCL